MSQFSTSDDVVAASIEYVREIQNHLSDEEAMDLVNRVFEAVEPGLAQYVTLALLRGELGRFKRLRLQHAGSCENKVVAIKAYRSVTGDGLKEAKEAIEEIMHENDAGKIYKVKTLQRLTRQQLEEEVKRFKDAGFKFY